ncbi:hypothetical protein [Micromonospora aurantiaca (nom. illeg.)]|uniref:hypothetical protein n=1 Tax=Micromonospora aurantiaca (nom. illeg.) TaxID=47850 RepID=UPI0033EA3760
MPREYSFYTWNLKDFWAADADTDRCAAVVDVIRELGATVIAVQEVIAADQATAMARLARLADLTGMTATVPAGDSGEADSGRPIYAGGAGGNRFATGLLWARDAGITVHPKTFRVYGGGDFFHSLTKVDLIIGGDRITVASWHGCPIGQPRRASEAERVVSALLSSELAIIGSDANTIGSARVPDGAGGYRDYDEDPYACRPWQRGFVHTCTWTTGDSGEVVEHHADRTAARIMAAGGLYDVAPTIGAPWTATAGHHRTDALGMDRRIDFIHATAAMVQRITRHQVHDTPLARFASDHLPSGTFWTASRPAGGREPRGGPDLAQP